MKICYHSVLDNFNEFEQDLAKEGRSRCAQLAVEEWKAICRYYLQEASWLNKKCVPTYVEYIRISC
ncbi:hypothetical protein Ancab_026164 [Ancistrocladus abbreviatus]